MRVRLPRARARNRNRLYTGTALLALLLLVVLTVPAFAVTHLKRLDKAPDFSLRDASGAEVSLAKQRGRITILLFGEAYHEKTRQACSQTHTVLRDPRFRDASIDPILIATAEVKAEDLQTYAADHLPALIARDATRQAFGAYQVAVMPSMVIVDAEGRVVHAVAGLSPRWPDVLADTLLFATGKLTAERFEQALNPVPTTAPAGADVRAERIAQLGRQLVRRGLDDLAVEKFTEALKLDPHHLAAHLDLGDLLLKRHRLPDAETHFRAVLAEQPASVPAALGLAFVQSQRGGDELIQAERRVRDLLAQNPSQARAHFLLGLICEQRHQLEDAAASYKKAAQLLLERTETEAE